MELKDILSSKLIENDDDDDDDFEASMAKRADIEFAFADGIKKASKGMINIDRNSGFWGDFLFGGSGEYQIEQAIVTAFTEIMWKYPDAGDNETTFFDMCKGCGLTRGQAAFILDQG